jgi:hypothetical protein
MSDGRRGARWWYLRIEKWWWLLVTPAFLILPAAVLTPLIAMMSAYALYLAADARLEASRARREAQSTKENP